VLRRCSAVLGRGPDIRELAGAVTCGGVAVFPGDAMVVDHDGAIVIPPALVGEVVPIMVEQKSLEGWIMGEVECGVSLPALYPANADNKARYGAWAKAQR
jgi:regulator of RNase E activity RraA